MKRTAAVLISAIMLCNLPTAPSRAIESDSAVLVQQQVNPSEAIITGENLPDYFSYEATLTVDNRNAPSYTGELVVGVYDAQTNAVVSVESISVTVPENQIFSKTVSKEYFEGLEYVKAFFWDENGTITPLTQGLSSLEDANLGQIILGEHNVWATDRQDNHAVAQMLQEGKDTYLAGEAQSGKPVEIYADLEAVYDLEAMEIGFHSASNQRSYSYSVEASTDGRVYNAITAKLTSSKDSDLPQRVEISGKARYVKIKVYGYNGNDWGWIRVNCLKLFGRLDNSEKLRLMNEDFNSGFKVEETDNSSKWFVRALDEETYRDYTPILGSRLYADIAQAPSDMGAQYNALHIYDDADRSTADGAGGAGVFRKLTVPENNADYTVKFKMFIPAEGFNINWSGISLLSQAVSGGNDLAAACAVQLRFENGANGGVKINMLDSVQFNEGYYRECFENEFRAGSTWDVEMKVSPQGKTAQVTVFDGEIRETQTIGYSYTDVERVNNQTWSNTAVNYICFNTGAGGKAQIYIDDFSVSCTKEIPVETTTVYSQSFNNASDLASAGVEQAVVQKNDDGTTGGSSLSSTLTASIASSNAFGSKVLKLTDTNTTDGLVVGIKLDLPDNNNKYIIKWRMRDFALNNYSGFSLGSGFNKGKTDTEHPLALQLRYSMQSDGVQLNRYSAATFNDGGYNAFLGTGNGNRLSTSTAWNFTATVNPLTKTVNITATDGSKTVGASASYADSDSDGNVIEDWSDKKVDTLLFHTAAGGKSDCIIDDIEVIDTGEEDAFSSNAVHGIVRLEGAWGKGKYLTSNGEENPTQIQGVDPDRTRFVERPGLANKNGVSFESCENPGYYLFARETDQVKHTYVLTLEKLQNTAQFKAQATFCKQIAANSGSYSGTTVSYAPLWDLDRSICYTNTSSDDLTVVELKDSDYLHNNLYYLRSEANNFLSDNFKGDSLNSQWHNNYPWKKANMTNDSYNFSALLDYRNIEVSDGRVLLKATKINSGDWPKNSSGETGIDYNGKYSKNYVKWAGRVGVISSKKVFHRQSLISGSFKQPESPIGYWNAFWLNAASGWPPETDIFEYMSHKGTNTWYTATHRQSNGSEVGYGNWQTVNGINVRTGYHDFVLDWGYNYMRFYVDGILYRDISSSADIDEQNKGLQLILNTGIGGWESEPDDTMVWDTGMECRWIRTFAY